jgi:hypothetical protein
MAKLYGSLVGTPVQGLMTSGAGFIPSDYKDGHDLILWRDYVTANNNVVGDQISFGLYPTQAYFDPYRPVLHFAPFGTGCTLNIGDVNHPTGIQAALSIATQGNSKLWPLSAMAPLYAQPLWQRLGYPTDPGGMLELLGTFGGANPANGASVAWQFWGRRH